MMRGVNKVIFVGNATRDAELRHTANGKPVAHLRLATNRSAGGTELTQYHSVVCWDTLAQTTSTYVKKGDPLYVEGRLEYRMSFAATFDPGGRHLALTHPRALRVGSAFVRTDTAR